MFGPKLFNPPLTINKMASGLSKTLNIINQIIPLYKETIPMVNNAKKALLTLKEYSNNAINKILDNKSQNIIPLKRQYNNFKINNQKGPTFFQ